MRCVPLCGAGDKAPWWQHEALCPARKRPEWYSGNTSGKRHGIGGQMISFTTPEPDWTPCEYGPFFIEGWPCCAGHARQRAESGDTGWWSDTTYPPCKHCGSTLRPGEEECPLCGPHAHGRPD